VKSFYHSHPAPAQAYIKNTCIQKRLLEQALSERREKWVHLLFVTPTLLQYRDTVQRLQSGDTGRHTFLPNDTISVLYLIQYSAGSFSRRANSVSFGFRVRT
jgi:hypothetical protein